MDYVDIRVAVNADGSWVGIDSVRSSLHPEALDNFADILWDDEDRYFLGDIVSSIHSIEE